MPDPRATSFSSGLAGVLFGSAPEPERAALEGSLVKRLTGLIETSTSSQIHRCGPWIDAHLLSHLSGRNLLHVARRIEHRAPAAIENMPLLRGKKSLLVKSAELAQIFAPAALDLMIEALQMDEEPGRGA